MLEGQCKDASTYSRCATEGVSGRGFVQSLLGSIGCANCYYLAVARRFPRVVDLPRTQERVYTRWCFSCSGLLTPWLVSIDHVRNLVREI